MLIFKTTKWFSQQNWVFNYNLDHEHYDRPWADLENREVYSFVRVKKEVGRSCFGCTFIGGSREFPSFPSSSLLSPFLLTQARQMLSCWAGSRVPKPGNLKWWLFFLTAGETLHFAGSERRFALFHLLQTVGVCVCDRFLFPSGSFLFSSEEIFLLFNLLVLSISNCKCKWLTFLSTLLKEIFTYRGILLR